MFETIRIGGKYDGGGDKDNVGPQTAIRLPMLVIAWMKRRALFCLIALGEQTCKLVMLEVIISVFHNTGNPYALTV